MSEHSILRNFAILEISCIYLVNFQFLIELVVFFLCCFNYKFKLGKNNIARNMALEYWKFVLPLRPYIWIYQKSKMIAATVSFSKVPRQYLFLVLNVMTQYFWPLTLTPWNLLPRFSTVTFFVLVTFSISTMSPRGVSSPITFLNDIRRYYC